MAVTLEVLNNETNLRRVQITRSAILGRGRKCGLRIASSKVSRQHCELILKEGSVEVRDLGSSNGTFVNNKPLVPRVVFELDPNDELRLGSVRLRVCFATETAADANDSDSSENTNEPAGDVLSAASVAAVAVGAAAGEISSAEPEFSDDDATAPADESHVTDLAADSQQEAENETPSVADSNEATPEIALTSELPAENNSIGSDDSFTLFSDDYPSSEDNSDESENPELDDSSILDFLGNLD